MSAKGLKLRQELVADIDFEEGLREARQQRPPNDISAAPIQQEGGIRPDAGAVTTTAAPAVDFAAHQLKAHSVVRLQPGIVRPSCGARQVF
jgi:hypothetical protein